jgi:hypothetical protein
VQRGLLLEYDDDWSGSFTPLRDVPNDKMVILGLISTTRPQIKTPEDLTRITESKSVLCHWSGWRSGLSAAFPLLSLETTKERKLERVCETARRIGWILSR